MMKCVAEKMVNETNELVDSMVAMFGTVDVIENLDSNTLDWMQKSLQLIKTSNELILTQARIIDDMNRKLDMLLKEKKES